MNVDVIVNACPCIFPEVNLLHFTKTVPRSGYLWVGRKYGELTLCRSLIFNFYSIFAR